MKVDIWLDLGSPWCAIGKKRFLKALESFSGKENVKIVWHAAETDPTHYHEEALAKEKELVNGEEDKANQIEDSFPRIKASGRDVGLEFLHHLGVHENTKQAHLLVKWAESLGEGLGSQLFDGFNDAYFRQGRSLENTDSLLDIVEEMDLNRGEAELSLKEGRFETSLQEDEQKLLDLRPSGYPLFLFRDEWQVSGAQEIKTFLVFLEANFGLGTPLWRQEQGTLGLFWRFLKNLFGFGDKRRA